MPYLQAGGVLGEQPSERDLAVLHAAAPLIQTRVQVLGEAVGMLGFLFAADDELTTADDAVTAVRADAPGSLAILDAAVGALSAEVTPTFEHAEIEAALRSAIVDGLGVKPKVAFTPLRVAVTGRRISPPLFESMQILGREACVARLAALRAKVPA